MSVVDDYLAGLDEPRRSTVARFDRTIQQAVPGLDVRVYGYGGTMLGYGAYPYRTSAGVEGEWFALGVAARKRYVSFYSTALREDRYLLEVYADRLPGAKVLRSCVNVTKPDLLDDEVLAEISRETIDFFRDRLLHPPRPGG
jgi:hypothetical protein